MFLIINGLHIQYLCVCKGRVWACGLSGEMPTKALVLGSKLIKAVEQMVQTWSGHNEPVSGETNRTWQDSCVGFVRWPEFRRLPGVRLLLQPRREWSYLQRHENFLRSNCIRRCLFPPNVCVQNNFYWKWIMPCQQGVFIFLYPILNHSILAGVFW